MRISSRCLFLRFVERGGDDSNILPIKVITQMIWSVRVILMGK